jgi:hypothetical protein
MKCPSLEDFLFLISKQAPVFKKEIKFLKNGKNGTAFW